LLGAFNADVTFAVVATSGVILSAVYMLWVYQRVIFGEVTNPKNKQLTDLDFREKLILLPLVALIFWMGIYSESFLRKMDTSVNQVLQHVKSSAVVVKN
jgi:NADH-quinone oxidoreductase subunit M